MKFLGIASLSPCSTFAKLENMPGQSEAPCLALEIEFRSNHKFTVLNVAKRCRWTCSPVVKVPRM